LKPAQSKCANNLPKTGPKTGQAAGGTCQHCTCHSSAAACPPGCQSAVASALPWGHARGQPRAHRVSRGVSSCRHGLGFFCCRPRGSSSRRGAARRDAACHPCGVCGRRVVACSRSLACRIRCTGGGCQGRSWRRGGEAGGCSADRSTRLQAPAARHAGFRGRFGQGLSFDGTLAHSYFLFMPRARGPTLLSHPLSCALLVPSCAPAVFALVVSSVPMYGGPDAPQLLVPSCPTSAHMPLHSAPSTPYCLPTFHRCTTIRFILCVTTSCVHFANT
jgi:hypothetical protein